MPAWGAGDTSSVPFTNNESCHLCFLLQGDWHTIFPSPYTIAATFDTDLMHEIGKVIGREARAGGIHQCWSPVCGLAREPRWGRSEEERSHLPPSASP